MSCGFDGCNCGDVLNHPRDHVAEAEARRDALPTYRRRTRLPWHTDDASRTHDPREDDGRTFPLRNAASDGAEEGNDGWATGRAEGCNE